MALNEGLQLLKYATHHDHFQRYHEASFIYVMAVESLQQAHDGFYFYFTNHFPTKFLKNKQNQTSQMKKKKKF